MSGSVGGAQDGLYPYDLTTAQGGPRVPDEDDLGGTEIEDGDPPPQQGSERHAGMDNVQTATLAGLCRLTATCLVRVEYSGSEYVIAGLNAMGRSVTASNFAFTINGTGDVTMEWDENTLPPQSCDPRVRVTGAFGHAYATAGVDEATIFLANPDGTAAHHDFEIEIRG